MPLLHATCKQIVTSAVGVLSAHKESLGASDGSSASLSSGSTELGRQMRELGRNVHVVGWLGLGGWGVGGTGCFLFVCLLLHSIGFMLFIAKVRAEPWARTPET